MQVENISNLFIKKQKKKLYQVNIDESVEITDILDKWRLSLV